LIVADVTCDDDVLVVCARAAAAGRWRSRDGRWRHRAWRHQAAAAGVVCAAGSTSDALFSRLPRSILHTLLSAYCRPTSYRIELLYWNVKFLL